MTDTLAQNTAITHWQQQIAPLADACEHADQMLETVGQMLGDLYQQAKDAGDDNAVNEIVVVWDNTQKLAGLIPEFAAAFSGGKAAVETLHQQRNEIAEELDGLMQALADFDVNDPRLRSFVEILEEEFAENFYDYAYDDVEEMVYTGIYEEFHTGLMTGYHTSHTAIGALLDALKDNNVTAEQHALVQQLLDTFALERTTS